MLIGPIDKSKLATTHDEFKELVESDGIDRTFADDVGFVVQCLSIWGNSRG